MIDQLDRYYIERKYHDPEKDFDPFRRMAYHGIGYREDSGLTDEALLAGLDSLAPSLEKLPNPVARAEAIRFILENERLYINEHDYFVGLYSLNRLANRVTFQKWYGELPQFLDPTCMQDAADFNASGAVTIWTDYDHVVPDWKAIMELGFPGLRQRARDFCALHREQGTLTPETEAFFAGMEIQYTAILNLLDRMVQVAEGESFPKAEAIAKCLKQLRDGRPTNFYEALQCIFLFFLISESVDSFQVRSLGNGLDQTLYPFYVNDLKNGTYTREEMGHFLSYFLLQWQAIGNYWGQPFYMGGTDREGNSRYNELSQLILDVYDELEIYNPKIQLKINTNTPDFLLRKAFDMVRRKNASFVFCCEPGMIRAVQGYGATWDEAWDYDIRGCYETGVRGNEVSATSGYINAAKAVEYVFTNGFDVRSGKQVGIQTGELSEIGSFEAFFGAFLRQWGSFIERSMRITNDQERFLSYVNPSSMYSATIETALLNARDGYAGGVRFNNSAMLNCGFASAVDSLSAVREFVFEKAEISLEDLAEVLKRNWEGAEVLQRKVRNSVHKYGNDDSLTEELAQRMSRFFTERVNGAPNARGGVYKAIMHTARQHIEQGYKTGALPDGRCRGEELSKNASPVIGMDRSGVTALIQSAAGLSPWDYHESFCVDVLFHPSALAGEAGYAAFRGLLMAYLQQGGQSIQFNVFDTETLLDAQKHPENYGNLQIRICGWNALWVNVKKEEQDAYIRRTRNQG